MKTALKTIAIVAILASAGCASIPQSQLDAIFHDLQGCKRSYQGGTGGAGLSAPSFNFSITCEPTIVGPQPPAPTQPVKP